MEYRSGCREHSSWSVSPTPLPRSRERNTASHNIGRYARSLSSSAIVDARRGPHERVAYEAQRAEVLSRECDRDRRQLPEAMTSIKACDGLRERLRCGGKQAFAQQVGDDDL